MNEPEDAKTPETPEVPEMPELEETRLEEVAGGLDLCSADQYRQIADSATGTYESVVDFTSHVIERVADSLK